jgi:hypothetical protein
MPLDADELRLAHYYDEDFSKPTGESTADIMVRDQIRRCELLLGRPLTEEQREIIRSRYASMGQRHAPNEQSEQSAIQPAPADEEEALDTPDAVCNALRTCVAQLDSQIEALGSRRGGSKTPTFPTGSDWMGPTPTLINLNAKERTPRPDSRRSKASCRR